MARIHIDIPREKVIEFCTKWGIREFALFGSVLRDDFGPESDIDVLITFNKDVRRTLFDIVDMEEELKEIFGRNVDLVMKDTLKPRIKDGILKEAVPV